MWACRVYLDLGFRAEGLNPKPWAWGLLLAGGGLCFRREVVSLRGGLLGALSLKGCG